MQGGTEGSPSQNIRFLPVGTGQVDVEIAAIGVFHIQSQKTDIIGTVHVGRVRITGKDQRSLVETAVGFAIDPVGQEHRVVNRKVSLVGDEGLRGDGLMSHHDRIIAAGAHLRELDGRNPIDLHGTHLERVHHLTRGGGRDRHGVEIHLRNKNRPGSVAGTPIINRPLTGGESVGGAIAKDYRCAHGEDFPYGDGLRAGTRALIGGSGGHRIG